MVSYRREIDGLRAVAVVPVILFHAGFKAFSGGFVGVDVFFVISGYLITTIILAEKERGTFSLVDFYERRTRRILPALFFVILVCLPFAWFWLLPSDLKDFSQSLVAVSTFSSNMLFWQTSGYWGIENELIPLLHTWSLAVEEQYYIVFPLFLMLMWRFRKRWILGSFLIIAAASLIMAQWGSYHHPTATFFMLSTRGWELAIGATIAFYFIYRKQTIRRLLSHKAVDEALSIIGFAMIAYAVFVFDHTVPFPGFYALVPTVGTGLIILFSSEKTIVGKLLGCRPLVAIGLISYSAYLWHQPLFAFARYRSLTGPSELLLAALAVCTIPLAYLSWRYVEKPFREKGLFTRKAIFGFAGVGSAFLITIGLAGHFSGGWPDRMNGKVLSAVLAAEKRYQIKDLCLASDKRDYANKESCELVRSDKKRTYLLGDSHAREVAGAMKTAFEERGIGLIQAVQTGCPPVQDVYVYVSESDKQRCFDHNQEVYRHLEESPDIEYVVLIARWALYIEGVRFDNGEGGIEREEILHCDAGVEEKSDYRAGYDRVEHFGQAYRDSVNKLLGMGKKVILVYPIPEGGWNVPRYFNLYAARNPDNAFSQSAGSTSHKVFQARNKNVYQALYDVGDHPNLIRVYPEKIFCNNDVEDRCIVQKDDYLLYQDDDHLSAAGAKLVINEIISHLE